MKVLIADDDDLLRPMYRKFLEKAGYAVLEARDGSEALAMALHDKPDLVVLDVLMPGKDGFEVLKTIREHDAWGKNLPVIMLTAKELDEGRLQEVSAWAPSYYLVKGNTASADLIEKVAELCRKG